MTLSLWFYSLTVSAIYGALAIVSAHAAEVMLVGFVGLLLVPAIIDMRRRR